MRRARSQSDPRRLAPRSGFTLLEVILAMGLSFLVLGALYQAVLLHARFSEYAGREGQRPFLARTILHRMADELRAIPAPVGRGQPAVVPDRTSFESPIEAPIFEPGAPSLPLPSDSASTARTLLQIGRQARENARALATAATTISTAPRFGLLGTRDRLVLIARGMVPEDALDDSDEDEAEGTATKKEGGELAKLRPRQSPGAIRQIFYARPARIERNERGEEFVLERGLVRQEVENPFALEAGAQAVLALEPLLIPKAEDRQEREPNEPLAGPDHEKVRIDTRSISDDIEDIRFRYHDGGNWREQWDRADALPIAVEISLRMAGGPESKTAPFDESAIEETIDPELIGERQQRERWPYRLVVHLPQAGRARSPQSAKEAERPTTLPKSESPIDGPTAGLPPRFGAERSGP